jgi:hypothetical protein
MSKLCELADVFAGVIVNRYQSEANEPSKLIRVYRASQCVSALNGQLSAPKDLLVKDTFHKEKQELRAGDILLPSRFTRPGCGVIRSDDVGTYASGNVYVVRASDSVVAKFLSIYFTSEAGKSAISVLSKEVPSYGSSAINVADLRLLELPNYTKAYMQRVVDVNEQMIETQAKLTQQSNFLNQLIGEEGISQPEMVGDMAVDSNEQLLQDAQTFLLGATAAGMATSVGKVQIVSGRTYSVSKTASNACVIENMDSGGLLVARGDQILFVDGITSLDREKFRYLAETSTNHLQVPCSQSDERDFC